MIRLTSSGVPTATQQVYTYEIIEKLCKPYCVNQDVQPVVNAVFSVSDQQVVGTQVYANVQAVITVTYKPKGRQCPCSYRTNMFIENVVISAPGSAISVASSAAYTDPSYVSTSNCNNAQGVKNVGVLTATITA